MGNFSNISRQDGFWQKAIIIIFFFIFRESCPCGQLTFNTVSSWGMDAVLARERYLAEAPVASTTDAKPVKYICVVKMLRAFIKIH